MLSANIGHQSPTDVVPYAKLRVSVSSKLRRVYGSKEEEITGGLTKLHNEELHTLYSASNILGQSYKNFSQKTKRMRPLAKPTHR